MTHTNCGIVNFTGDDRRDALAGFLGCSSGELSSRAVTDPREAVRRDIAILAASPQLPSELSVTGIVYDVQTGRTEVIERNSPLRQASQPTRSVPRTSMIPNGSGCYGPVPAPAPAPDIRRPGPLRSDVG